MSLQVDEVRISTVDLTTATSAAAGVGVGSPATEGGVTLASLDANGLLTYRPDLCGSIALANGSVVKAIAPILPDGAQLSATEYADITEGGRGFRPLLIRAADGSTFTVEHDQAPPAAEWSDEHRIMTQYGQTVTVGPAWIYTQWAFVGGVRRWMQADWSGYLPGDPADWAGAPAYLSLWSAVDRLAAAYAAQHGAVP